MVRVVYEHWKTKEQLVAVGNIFDVVDSRSDRLVLEVEPGIFEDILKNTIIQIEDINDDG